jgi:hypothetical protein
MARHCSGRNDRLRCVNVTHSLLLLPLIAGSLVACGKTSTLTVKPGDATPPELLPSEQLEKFVYKKILVLPIEKEVEIKDTSIKVLRDKDAGYYSTNLEKALLTQGFEVISSEIVARAQKGVSSKLSGAEKALIMGKETKADAVFIVQRLTISGTTDYFTVRDLKTDAVEANLVKSDKKGRLYHAETEECVFRLPYYQLEFEGKLIDARSGGVLWVGSTKHTVVDALDESWVAKLDKDCALVNENFSFGQYVAGETALASTYDGLLAELLPPLKKSAFSGQPLVFEEDKPKPKPKPAPPPAKEPEPPKVPTAVVSAKKAALRAGPGSRNERMGYVTRKTKVEVLETMGSWSKVKLQDGRQGWLHDSTFIVNE